MESTKSLKWRMWLTFIVAALGVVYILPTLGFTPAGGLAKIMPDKKINLGLDLMGGIHLTLGVDIDKAVETAMAQAGQDLRPIARDEDVTVLRAEVLKGERLQFFLLKPEQRQKLEDILKRHYPKYIVLGTESQEDGKLKYILGLKPESRKELADMTVDQAVKTIRNRVDQFGVAEPDIRKQQDNRIQVQLPGLKDPKRAIEVLGKTAHLEFKLVDDEADIEKAQKGMVPPGDELSSLRKRAMDGTYSESPIVLKKEVLLSGEYISDANTNFDSNNQPYVGMTFNDRGATLFARITGEHVKKRLAIVLDGKVYSAPVIQEKIGGGRATITGHFTTEEAHDLAIVLRAGALPAPVKVLEERSVGPSMGQESIDKGVKSALLGGALIVVFMGVYYGLAGLVANGALMLNVVLTMAGLAAFGATLTMPGIAGIVLTIGIAVDANVLIYERIREELRLGLPPRAAVEEGYARAMMTIFDANLSTIIAAVILYQFGTGPIRGFAVTLILGVLASMFTAIFVTRIIFDLWLEKRPGAKLSI